MHMFIIQAQPGENAEEYRVAGGAHVHAFIDFADEWGAQELAKLYIVKEGWIPEKVESADWVAREELNPEAQEAYDEAADEGFAFIYEMWPVDTASPNA